MKKIPVGATVAHAYRFAFLEFFNLLKLTWLPLVVTATIGFTITTQMPAILQAIQTRTFQGLPIPLPLFVLLYAVSLFAILLQLTAMYQYALGQIDARGRWFYLAWGKAPWRLLGAVALLILSLIALLVLYIIAIIILLFIFRFGLAAFHISAEAIKSIAAFDGAIAFVIAYFGFIFCTVRFGFLLLAATIAENRIALARSWKLSHGNFWRIFVIILATFLPFFLLEFGAMYAAGMFHFPPLGATADQIQALQQQQALATMQGMQAMQKYWYITNPLFLVFATLFYGLAAGAQSFAYRKLTDGDATSSPH